MAARRGAVIPPVLINAPELFAHNLLPWRAFWNLRRGPEPTVAIKWVDVQYWCQTHELDYEAALALHDCIAALDDVFVGKFRKDAKLARQKAEARQNANKNKR